MCIHDNDKKRHVGGNINHFSHELLFDETHDVENISDTQSSIHHEPTQPSGVCIHLCILPIIQLFCKCCNVQTNLRFYFQCIQERLLYLFRVYWIIRSVFLELFLVLRNCSKNSIENTEKKDSRINI